MTESLSKIVVYGLSVLVALIVTLLFFIPAPKVELGFNIHFFPAFHAFLNGSTAVLLLIGLYFIKNKNVSAHKASMLGAFVLSTIFLLSYVFYHAISEPTTYGGQGTIKYIYYFVLLTHIVLAAGVLPFILFTFLRAFNKQFDKHKRLARWTWPVWFYVAVTGVVVYFMISPYYA